MDIGEHLKEHGIEFKVLEVRKKEEFEGFKIEELKDADFSKFDDNQLKAAHLLVHKYMKEPKVFSEEEWKQIHERIVSEMEKRNISHSF